MATNQFFNFFEQNMEQGLFDDLVVESVRMYGHDMKYLPRDINTEDKILTEPVIQTFSKALDIEMYIKSWDSFEGEGQLLSKFGLEIRDQMTLIMTKRSFAEFIQPTTGKERPWEGDCIYIPLLGVVYQIKYVDTSYNFYTLGKLYSWQIVCELLEFNNEQFVTGIPEIDNLNPPFEHFDDPDYDLDSYDKTSQNTEIQNESDQIVDWTESSPFGDA